jgi:APA family basic amino acid/polyamine antiporter
LSESSKKPKVFTREATGLVRAISPLDSFAAGFGGLATISLFLFFPIFMSTVPNDNVFLTIGWMTLPVFAFAANWALLQAAFPRSGGDYVFNTRLIHPSIGIMTDFLVVSALPLNFPFYAITLLGLLSDMLKLDGIAASNTRLTSAGTFFQNVNFEFTVVTILALATMLFMIGRTRIFFRTQMYVFLVSMFALLGIFALLAATPNSTYQLKFSSFFGTSYQSVLHNAQSSGFTMPLLVGVSLLGMSQLFFWGTGTNWAGHVAGEIQRPQKSLLYSIVGSLGLYLLLYFILGSLSFSTFGTNFSYAVNFLSGKGASPIPDASGALFLVLAAPLFDNPIILTIVFLIVAATSFYIGSLAVIAASRKVFAWSFDRILPSKFSDVSPRFRTPIYAALLVFAITEVYVVLSFFGPGIYAIVSGLGVVYTGIFMVVSFVSGILLPLRKQYFQQAPPLVRAKIGPVPVITLIAVFGLITTGYVLGLGQLAPLVTSGVSFGPAAWTIVLFFGGLVFYYLLKTYRKRVDGIDLGIVYGEIPPE